MSQEVASAEGMTVARYDKSHKSETRRRIIDSAGRRLKRDGIDGSGVAALMSDAGLTNGAFYAHFGSKNDLVANVVADQLEIQAATMKSLPPGREAIEQFIRGVPLAGSPRPTGDRLSVGGTARRDRPLRRTSPRLLHRGRASHHRCRGISPVAR